MAVYINYGEGEADATIQAAEWLQKSIHARQGDEAEKAFKERFQALYKEEGDDIGPIFDLFLDNCLDLFEAIPESKTEEKTKDIESFYAVVFSMLLLLEEAEHIDRSTSRLCEIVGASLTQHPDVRLRLLMSLYNSFPATLELRYRVFKCTIDYAAKAQLFDQVSPYLEYLDAWMADWSPYLKVEDKCCLFRDLATYVRQLGKRGDAFAYLKTYHGLLQGSKIDALSKDAKVMASAAELIVDAIQLPAVVQFDDLLKLDSVKAMAKTPDGGLVKLCEIYYDGTVDDFRAFHGKNGPLFKKHSLDLQETTAKMKLLTLATMARSRQEITLKEVAEKLEENPDGIETWVVRGISEGLIDGRIDQLNGKVLVKSAFQRKFGNEEWAFLDSKLSAWTENLESVLRHMEEHKHSADGAPAAALQAAAAQAQA